MPSSSGTQHFDVVVVGGGSAGYAAARTLVSEGPRGIKVAVVEGGREMGGLCILRGCMPTKALLESSHRFHDIRHADEFGLKVGSASASWPKMIARKDALIEDFASYRRKQLVSGKFKLIRGHAAFLDRHRMEVVPVPGEKGKACEIEAKAFVLATGSVTARRPVPGLEESGYWTSDDAIHARKPFKSLIVLGGRAVALEFAQYFSHLGVKVDVIQRSDRILPHHDPDVSETLTKVFQREGMQVHAGTEIREVKKVRGRYEVTFKKGRKSLKVVADQLLNALGREAATEGLRLELAGVETSGKQVKCGLNMQSSQKHIFAAGDVAGPYEVVHIGIQQGELAARNVLRLLDAKRASEKMDYRLKADVIFTRPEAATVGLTETEARAHGIDFLSEKYPFDDHGKSMIMGATDGFVKILCEKKRGEIIGAQVLGPCGSDLIHEFIVAMHYRATVHQFKNIPHYHPTLAEIVTYPAEDLSDRLSG